MARISIEEFSFPKYDDIDVINAWEWMMSFLSDADWEKRKNRIEQELNDKLNFEDILDNFVDKDNE